MYKYTWPVQALFLHHFDVLLVYRTPAKLLISDETYGIPFNFKFCLGRMEQFQFLPCPTRSMGAGECRHPCGALVDAKTRRQLLLIVRFVPRASVLHFRSFPVSS